MILNCYQNFIFCNYFLNFIKAMSVEKMTECNYFLEYLRYVKSNLRRLLKTDYCFKKLIYDSLSKAT